MRSIRPSLPLSSLAIVVVVILLPLYHRHYAYALVQYVGERCETANDELNALNSKVDLASRALYKAYNDTCWDAGTCSATSQSDLTTTTRDFGALTAHEDYTALRSACDDLGASFTLCEVTNVVQRTLFKTVEHKKPVCFPNSCTEGDVRILDPSPANCENGVYTGDNEDCTLQTFLRSVLNMVLPQKLQKQKQQQQQQQEECTITSTTVTCPQRPASQGICSADAKTVTDNDNYERKHRKLYQIMIGRCLQVIFGTADGACRVNAEVNLVSVQDYTGFESHPSFLTFLNECLGASNSMLCRTSVRVQADVSESIVSLSSDLTFRQYPFCLAEECDIESDSAVVAEVISDRYPCDPTKGTCVYDLSSYDCV